MRPSPPRQGGAAPIDSGPTPHLANALCAPPSSPGGVLTRLKDARRVAQVEEGEELPASAPGKYLARRIPKRKGITLTSVAHRERAFKDLAAIASPSASEGLKKPRSILLLWFLRHVMGVDDLEAYDYICDGNEDQGVDGLIVEPPAEPDEKGTLVLLQSKYPQGPTAVGVNDLKNFVGTASSFQTVSGIRSLYEGNLEAELRVLIDRYDLQKHVAENELTQRLIFVTAGYLNIRAERYVSEVNASEGAGYLRVYDLDDLAPMAAAFRKPTMVRATQSLACTKTERFASTTSTGKVVIAAIKAAEISTWPGIDDRTLFELNVRRELRRNRVRLALENAVRRPTDHLNFLAFHNGLTVICEGIDDSSPRKLLVSNFSVANGAQSTIAFRECRDAITDDLRVVVKFVEAKPEQQLAREVGVRSNNQNPVTPRNLKARDGIQLTLEHQFRLHYPTIVYETRPDATISVGPSVIQNDFAAQLLCAVYNRRPWLAIKRTALFESEFYSLVFNRDTTADHIVLVNEIANAVQAVKAKFPESYLRTWQLTRLVAVFLVGEILRADPEGLQIIDEPSRVRTARSKTLATINNRGRFAAAALKRRHDHLKSVGALDDFKVDFKREQALRDLAKAARETYVTYLAVELD